MPNSLLQNHSANPGHSWKLAACLALICTTSACSSLQQKHQQQEQKPRQECDCETRKDAESERRKTANLDEQRRILSEGYSLLYRDATRLDLTKLILLAKSESDQIKTIVKDVADFGSSVKKDLERIDKDYPGVRTDLEPLPEMETRKRWAVGKDKAFDFAPGIGRSGRDYERTVLISLMNGVNHERHMCKVMAEEESDANLKQFLLNTEKGYDKLYERIDALLQKEYFK